MSRSHNILNNWSKDLDFYDRCLSGYRKIRPETNNPYRSYPFAQHFISNFSHISKPLSHERCINSVKWSLDGNYLLTAGDDRDIKLWNAEKLPDFNLSSTIRTSHTNNIFFADMSPCDSNIILSCGADGHLIYHELSNPRAQVRLLTSDDMIHMLIFGLHDPNVVYTAEETGQMHRVDLRSRHVDMVFENMTLGHESEYFSRSVPLKYIIQHPSVGEYCIIHSNDKTQVNLMDLRYAKNERIGRIQAWEPYSKPPYEDINHVIVETPNFYEGHPEMLGNFCSTNHQNACVSGMSFSSDGTKLLVNYQHDQIYAFKMHRSKDQVPRMEGSAAVYGGHHNVNTFLKNVSYFGPNDEYVVAGSDSGEMWIWDAKSGYRGIVRPKEYLERTAEVVACLKADTKTCNGAVPHPYLPYIVSYGIDNTAKVWGFQYDFSDEHLDESERTSKLSSSLPKAVSTVIPYHKRLSPNILSKKRCYSSSLCLYDHDDMEELGHRLEWNRFRATKPSGSYPVNALQYGHTVYAIRQAEQQKYIATLRRSLMPDVKFSDLGPDFPSDFILGFDGCESELVWNYLYCLICISKACDMKSIDNLYHTLDRFSFKDMKSCDLSSLNTIIDDWGNHHLAASCDDRADTIDTPASVKHEQEFTALWNALCIIIQHVTTSTINAETEKFMIYWRSVSMINAYFIAMLAKQNGSLMFKEKRFPESIHFYRKAIFYLEFMSTINNKKFANHIATMEMKHYYESNALTDADMMVTHNSSDYTADMTAGTGTKKYVFPLHWLGDIFYLAMFIYHKKKDLPPVSVERLKILTPIANELKEIDRIIGSWEDEMAVNIKSMTLACMNNIVASYMQMNLMTNAMHMSDRAKLYEKYLNLDKPDMKLLYRRGCIYASLKEYKLSLNELNTALAHYPADTTTMKKIKEVKDALEANRKLEAKKYSKMFG